MPPADITCMYEELVQAATGNKPLVISGSWLTVIVDDLTPGEFYVAPLLFWSNQKRFLAVEIRQPDDMVKVIKHWEMEIGATVYGKNDWLEKRYKLNEERQNGKAIFRIGWPLDDPKDPPKSDFSIIAAPLTSKKITRRKMTDEGRCPDCGETGYWVRLALVCAEHGAFG